ncbi:formyltransferase family protein [Muricoccus vinaceus]|uniref:Formyltransferase family protein n=1 Tax=Muricoccus vinaceus TaxID=424704 RepID=A0ABV6IV02_9PROT
MAAFARGHRDSLALVGLSNPYRRNAGGQIGQALRHLRRSGPRMLGYLAVNMALPRLASAVSPGPGPLARLCREEGVPLVAVEDVNGPAFHAALRASGAELIVSFHFDQILSAETLARVPLGGINVHPSLLPRHRGPIPAFWAGLEAEPAFGVTVHRLVPRIDAGPVLAQRAVALPPGCTASRAARLLHLAAVPLASAVLAGLARGGVEEWRAEPLPYCPFPSRADLARGRARGHRLLGPGDVRAAFRARL